MFFRFLIFLLSLSLFAQDEEILFFLKDKSQAVYDKDKNFSSSLYFNISSGWHINAHIINDEFLIPTEIKIEENNLKIDNIFYPEGERINLSFSKEPLVVYSNNFSINLEGKIKEKVDYIKGRIIYQGCNDEMCIPPRELEFKLDFKEGSVVLSNPFEKWLSKGGILLALLFLFIGGLALNLTPCVYPMVPITIGFFSKQRKSFLFSFFYFLGIVITYSLLGTLSAIGGSLFGSALQKPLVLIFVSLIIFLFSLSLFGLFTIKLPSSFTSKTKSKIGFLSSFFMGSMVGLVAAPCLGPIILSLITFVASKGDVFIGFIFFLALSSGLGIPYLILSFFSSSIKNLPKSGEWMISLERFFGFALVAVSIFILSPIFPSRLPETLFFILGFISAIYFFTLIFKRNLILNFILMSISLFFSIQFIDSILPKNEPKILFSQFEMENFLKDKSEGKLIIVDFYANWCIPCKEMEHKTFSNKEVQDALRNFIPYQVDLTREPKGSIKSFVEEMGVQGIPTIIFFKNGEEIKNLRLVGYEGPEEFKKRLENALK